MFASTVDYNDGGNTENKYYDREKYVMWGFSARDDTFRLPANLAALDGAESIAAVMTLMDGWHPALQRLVQTADVSTVTTFDVKTSVPIRPWTTRNVTLLGDALHNMTPFRGIGANTALRDAALLRR
jgi:2-polyprenyl-6-methoxyphenol hydroxylase-like FAD-dependent oxidoreductase